MIGNLEVCSLSSKIGIFFEFHIVDMIFIFSAVKTTILQSCHLCCLFSLFFAPVAIRLDSASCSVFRAGLSNYMEQFRQICLTIGTNIFHILDKYSPRQWQSFSVKRVGLSILVINLPSPTLLLQKVFSKLTVLIKSSALKGRRGGDYNMRRITI